MPDSFFRGRLRSIQIALNGFMRLVRSEPNMQVHVVAALLVTALGFYFKIRLTEWALQWLAVGMVIGMEALNTALEELSNKVESKPDPQIKQVKDFAAGAVVFSALIALVVGLLIYIPKISAIL